MVQFVHTTTLSQFLIHWHFTFTHFYTSPFILFKILNQIHTFFLWFFFVVYYFFVNCFLNHGSHFCILNWGAGFNLSAVFLLLRDCMCKFRADGWNIFFLHVGTGAFERHSKLFDYLFHIIPNARALLAGLSMHTLVVFIFLTIGKSTLISLQILFRMISPWYVVRWLPLELAGRCGLPFKVCISAYIFVLIWNLEIKINDKIMEPFRTLISKMAKY